MDPVNGIVISDQPSPRPNNAPEHGQIQTADFQASGNLKALYFHLKETYEPKAESKSGPIKPLTAEELSRENQRPQEDAANSIPPTVLT